MIKNISEHNSLTCFTGSCTPEDKITLFFCTVTFAQAALPIVRIGTGIGTLWTVVSFGTLYNVNAYLSMQG